ncbi:hypothetical protein K469DRAFT_649632 [Zopfia rhizophila CBS 207.26]|uniref:Chromosome segregation ATPase family protein n=1 Tax=Zopfia rhizophila CBS 207.26 TaxID=1314779 RepID=A0A6A6F094_9PEZI|nr:hypothetical protein K469DRAFT_649632 [Zopfia rhizophila CBS 207.26]
MPSIDRDSSRDRELVKHQHSFSEIGRSPIPMWDSSDPERAPPPLPLNPGSPSLATRPNTSAAIANAAKALEEKARESLPASSYTTNPMPQRSPERSLIKGAQHKRMQSLQTTSVRDLRSFLDGVRSPERSPERPTERPATRSGTPARDADKDYFANTGDHSPSRTGTPTPSTRDVLKDTPNLRPSSRPLQKAILGENTPPSATMLALQTMTVPREHLDPPLSNITNSSSSTKPAQTPQTFDAISNQLLSITTIVSNLQKEMSQLNRRSKDNATDLISLKETTSSRDEDIRKSLRELVTTMNQSAGGDMSRSGSSLGMKDPHMTPTKQFTLPRIHSPNSFLMDERIGSPNPYSVEGAASVAMLEKIIREMVTKDGQERLLASLQKLVDKATGDTAKKVNDLVEFVKQGSNSKALVPTAAPGSASFQPSPGTGPLARTTRDVNSTYPMPKAGDGSKPYSSPKAADFVSDEMLKFLRKIKDSVAESGCVTMETKTLVRDLRGEVLGMGRELARKIEEFMQAQTAHPAIESGQPSQDLTLIVQNGLADLKQHMDNVMRERRRQSNSSIMTRNTVDSQEVYGVVKHALAERGLDQFSAQGALLDKEAIISAVREAYEAYKPEIEVQQFGLERDEILQCLQEGLQDYRGSSTLSKEEIMQTIQDSMQYIKLPPPINEAHEMREEVLMAVRECLEEFKPALIPHRSQGEGISRDIIMDAIKEGLANSDLNGPREIEINREDLFEAVRAGLEGSRHQAGAHSDAVMQRLQGLVDDMHSEFKSYSSANGRDTEQVLDALRDGLESLRAEIESYVDKAQDVTQKDEIVDTMRTELERLRVDVQGYVAEGPRGDNAWSRGDMVGYIKSEFEHLHEELSSQFLPAAKDKEELLNALNAGFEGMKSQVATRGLDLESNDEMNEAMKQEFEQLKDVILGDHANHKDEILEKLQSGFDELHAKLGDSSTATNSNDDVLAAMKEEFEHLRDTLGGTLVRSGGAADKEDMIDAVRELIDGLRSHLATAQQDASKENLVSIQGELERLRESLGSTLVRDGDSVDKEEILEALRSGLEEIKVNSKSLGINEELLEAFRGELEQVRQASGLTRQHSRADTEEVLEAIRLGLDDLRSHLEKRIDNPDRQMSATGEIIDALNEGLEGLRSDVAKMVDKPVDMTVSYEILDALKDGVSSIREDIDKLKGKQAEVEEEEAAPTGNEVVLAEDLENTSTRDVAQDSLRRNDLEKMEVMLAQLQIKVEAMDANIQNPVSAPEPAAAPGSAVKDNLVAIEESLKDLLAAVHLLQDREQTANFEGMATKEDTDAIETLLRNTKAKVEEIVFPDATTMVTKENLDDVELVVRTTSEAIEALSKKIEDEGATKADVAVVQVLADDIKTALDEIKAAKPEEEVVEEVTKADVDSLALLVCDIKAKLDEMKIPDGDEIPSKADVEQLTGLIHDFRDSHDKMKDSYESDIAITAKAFDDRKKEAESLVDSMTEVKTTLDEIKEEMKINLAEGGPMEGLKESFKSLEDTIGTNFSITADVKELMETVSREFERAHGSIEGLRNDQEEKSALTQEKHDEAKEAIIAGLVEKIDDRFNTLMAKYDDAQLLADEQAKVMKEKAEEQEKILENTKSMADELRLTIDTLGASITGMNDRFEEATQKLSTDSATIFEKIDNTIVRLEEHQLDGKTEHQHTRDEIANIERVFNGLQDNITEYHPKFMVTLREIQALVTQHYEHSRKARDAADEQVRAMTEEAKNRAEEMQNHFSKLPALLPPPPPAIEPAEKYDDTRVQEKLDKLLGHTDDGEKSSAQLERLDEIHKQVMATAKEVTDFVAKQTQLITDGHETKEREAEEVALLLERRLVQKEQLELDIQALKEERERTMQDLKEEKDSLLAIVAALQVERENLANQKVRLTGEVSSLHTALEIRREELHSIDAKADALERRILNGIMDHSRALMIIKGGPKNLSKPKKRMVADVSSDAKLMPPPSTAATGLSMALNPRPAIPRNGPPQNPASRRIHSLSQISGNTPTGVQAYPGASNTMANSGALKRSHSVKTNYMRKSSWAGRTSMAVAQVNKENEALSEESETEVEQPPAPLQIEDNHSIIEEDHDDQSETGTERRHSYGTSGYAESYADGETEGRSSYGGTGSEYTYASGSSYMTGSDIDRRTSYGSTVRSTLLGGADTIIDEEGEDSDSQSERAEDEEDTEQLTAAAPSEVTASGVSGPDEKKEEEVAVGEAANESNVAKKEIHVYTAPSDSGVGTDLPTAALEAQSEADYFRRAAEEESTVG